VAPTTRNTTSGLFSIVSSDRKQLQSLDAVASTVDLMCYM